MKKFLFAFLTLLLSTGIALAWTTPRWSTFPVNVYVANDTKSQIAYNALSSWASRGGAVGIKFRYLDAQKALRHSQIIIRFSDENSNELPYRVISASFKDENNKIYNYNGFFSQVTVIINKKDSTGRAYSDSELMSISLQAVGRSLGINCLSNSIDAVMSCNSDFSNNNLTSDDINALINVYKYVKKTK